MMVLEANIDEVSETYIIINVMLPKHMFSMDSRSPSALMKDTNSEAFINVVFGFRLATCQPEVFINISSHSILL